MLETLGAPEWKLEGTSISTIIIIEFLSIINLLSIDKSEDYDHGIIFFLFAVILIFNYWFYNQSENGVAFVYKQKKKSGYIFLIDSLLWLYFISMIVLLWKLN